MMMGIRAAVRVHFRQPPRCESLRGPCGSCLRSAGACSSWRRPGREPNAKSFPVSRVYNVYCSRYWWITGRNEKLLDVRRGSSPLNSARGGGFMDQTWYKIKFFKIIPCGVYEILYLKVVCQQLAERCYVNGNYIFDVDNRNRYPVRNC